MSDPSTARLTAQQVSDRGLSDWRVVRDALCASFDVDDYETGLALVARIGRIAIDRDHHPDLDLRFGWLNVATRSHDVDGLSERDVRLAEEVSDAARELGARPAPQRVQIVEVALDTPDVPGVRPFWAAVLGRGLDDALPDEVLDRRGATPPLWFQECRQEDAADPARMRFHLDVCVPHDVAEERVRAAIDAGGRLVSDDRARAFWVLEDAEGNKACVCTWQDRD